MGGVKGDSWQGEGRQQVGLGETAKGRAGRGGWGTCGGRQRCRGVEKGANFNRLVRRQGEAQEAACVVCTLTQPPHLTANVLCCYAWHSSPYLLGLFLSGTREIPTPRFIPLLTTPPPPFLTVQTVLLVHPLACPSRPCAPGLDFQLPCLWLAASPAAAGLVPQLSPQPGPQQSPG